MACSASSLNVSAIFFAESALNANRRLLIYWSEPQISTHKILLSARIPVARISMRLVPMARNEILLCVSVQKTSSDFAGRSRSQPRPHCWGSITSRSRSTRFLRQRLRRQPARLSRRNPIRWMLDGKHAWTWMPCASASRPCLESVAEIFSEYRRLGLNRTNLPQNDQRNPQYCSRLSCSLHRASR